jgi:hypothetical protein
VCCANTKATESAEKNGNAGTGGPCYRAQVVRAVMRGWRQIIVDAIRLLVVATVVASALFVLALYVMKWLE